MGPIFCCWLIAAVSAILSAQTLAQTQPSIAPTTAPVDELIKQLSADEWRTRETAQKSLIAMGGDAVAALRATTQRAVDDETRSRAESALTEILDNQVSGPSLITLHLHDQPVGTVFAELSKQCGIALEPITPELWQQRPVPPISIDVDHQPFWTVMHELTSKTSIVLQPWENTQRLAMTVGAVPHGPQVVGGAFQITADSVRRSQMINLAVGTTPNDDFGVTLSITAEPKIRLGRTWNEVQLKTAVDDHGNSLLPEPLPNRGGGGYYNGPGGTWSLQIPLRYPANNPGKKLAHLAGTMRAEIKTQVQTLQFDDVMTSQNVRKSLHNRALTLLSTEKQGAEYVLHLAVEMPNPMNGEADNDLSPQNFVLEPSSGRPFRLNGLSQTQPNNRRELELRFTPVGPFNGRMRGGVAQPPQQDAAPARLKWTVAAASKTVEIPFQFDDLPMP